MAEPMPTDPLAYRMGELDVAAAYYEKALKIAKSRNFIGMVAEIRNLQGSLARKTGDFAKARYFYEEAKRAIEKLEDSWRLTAVLRNLARMEFQLGRLEAARDGFNAAISLCQQIDRKDMLYRCQLRLAEVEKESGNHQEALMLAIKARDGFAELGMKGDLDKVEEFLEALYKM
jgi:tetratricopeptide (TPR) repeat protein